MTTPKKSYKFAGITPNKLKNRRNEGRDNFLNDLYKQFKPKEGLNTIRILPPSWENPEHFGYSVSVHYKIGANDSSYICLRAMGKGDDAVCKERDTIKDPSAEKERYKDLKYVKRILYAVVDRGNMGDGIKLWTASPTFDASLSKLSIDSQTGEIIEIWNPESGYDVTFDYVAKGKNGYPEYSAIQIARRPSSVPQEIVDFVDQNPIPKALVYHTEEYIASVFHGETPTEIEKESRASEPDDVPEIPSKVYPPASEPVTEEVMTYKDIMAMTAEDITSALNELELKPVGTLDQQKRQLCITLDIEVPPLEAPKPLSARDKLMALKAKRENSESKETK